jgi:hypothetical protein
MRQLCITAAVDQQLWGAFSHVQHTFTAPLKSDMFFDHGRQHLPVTVPHTVFMAVIDVLGIALPVPACSSPLAEFCSSGRAASSSPGTSRARRTQHTTGMPCGGRTHFTKRLPTLPARSQCALPAFPAQLHNTHTHIGSALALSLSSFHVRPWLSLPQQHLQCPSPLDASAGTLLTTTACLVRPASLMRQLAPAPSLFRPCASQWRRTSSSRGTQTR